MENKNQPAFPDPMRAAPESVSNQDAHLNPTGLTKREYFAGLAMQALISSHPGQAHNQAQGVTVAVAWADQLLKELEKPSNHE